MGTTTCPHCRGEVAEDATKCRHCGEWLNQRDARRAKGELPAAVKVVAVLVMLVLAYLLVMAVVGA